MAIDEYALLTPAEMTQADNAAIALGVSGVALMEAAGLAVAQAVQKRWSPRPLTVLCGPGNNGGDGFVAARHLASQGWPVTLGLLGSKEALLGDAAHHAALWTGAIEPMSTSLLDGAQLVIDALFGSGLSRALRGVARDVVRALSLSNIPVCAVDVPSGVDGGSGHVLGVAAQAALTVTFFRPKPGHVLLPGRVLCGEMVLADIGIPDTVLKHIAPTAYTNTPALWLDDYPWPRPDGYKYNRGHVLVVGGEIMTGAARLSALAAARVGAGLVTVAAPEPAWAVYASALTSVMVQPLDDAGGLAYLLADERRNVIVVGPGAGVSEATCQHVLAALRTGRAVVLDADAITSFRSAPQKLFEAIAGPCVLTPHEGEFSRIFDFSGSKLERARAAAAQCGAVVVLKGADTVVASPDGCAIVNDNAPPDLATGGTGDVLTGLIAGLMAQGLDPFHAAAAGVWLQGQAAQCFGPGLIAEDLPNILPKVLQQLKQWPVPGAAGAAGL